ncbi:IS3 family transposase [Rhodococcus sp. IEGM 1318]|uniref:IS3 family transposase n=1 Tax=Rhodococcus sp. IEGM 1318 TaxID=3082226 RepID=UPI00295564C2|nr:IS3 family transposase [Rhodococcus sp. IEGM 1318]MDV8009376.1 IS3 family transposase [Rhodococcus sp. IEGM 1318]
MPKRYPLEQRERAVKIVLDHLDEYRSVYSACQVMGPKLGIGAESLRNWTKQAQVDAQEVPGASTAEQMRIKELERENRELKEANEILKSASNFLREGTRPSPPLIVQFIDDMRAQNFRVESIGRVLTAQGIQVAPRTYRNWKTASPSARTITDAHLTEELRSTIGTAEGLYGRRKMTARLRRKGHHVAACTVDRLMRDEGLNGVVRGRQHRTTIPGGKDSRRAPDLLDRDFTADAPNRTWVTDFTYCRTWAGFVYVAFVIDCFSRAIVGWHASTVKDTAMVTTALKMALWRRDHGGHRVGDGLIHHSDAGSQYTSISFAETLVLEGIAASIGSVGDAYDNALAESTIGLFKTEAVSKSSPFLQGPIKTIDDIEFATMEWVDWFNTRRLHSTLDYVTPDEFEAVYYSQLSILQPEMSPA